MESLVNPCVSFVEPPNSQVRVNEIDQLEERILSMFSLGDKLEMDKDR